jgi:hypothetical protein
MFECRAIEPKAHAPRKETEQWRTKYKGALHDNPMTKIKAQEEAARRNSPKAKALERHAAEMHKIR